MTGIQTYGVHIPRYHITSDGYEAAVGRFRGRIDRKAVAPYDEDSVTMGIDAARDLDAKNPDLVTFAATRRPQPGTVASGVLIRTLGLDQETQIVEVGSSSHAGLEALTLGLRADSSLVVAGDDPRGDHDHPAEHVLGAGGAAVTTGEKDSIADLVTTEHFVDAKLPAKFDADGLTDLDLGQYSADGFDEAVRHVILESLATSDLDPSDVDHVVLPQDNIKTSWRVGKSLGFDRDQLETGFLVNQTGFAGAAMPLMGLAAALDQSKPGDYLLVSAYGYGHAASVSLLQATERIGEASANVETQLGNTTEISYDRYQQLTGSEN